MPKRPLPSSLAASKTRVRFHQPVRFTSKPDRVIEFNVHRRETEVSAAAPEVATAPQADGTDAPERRLSRTLSPVNMGGRPRRHSVSADEVSVLQPGDDDGMSRWGDDEEDVIDEDGSWRSRASEEDRGDEDGAAVRSMSAPPCTQADAARDERRGHHLAPAGVSSPASAQRGRGAAASVYSVSAPAVGHLSQFPPPLPSHRSPAPAASAAGPHSDSRRRSASVPPRIASLDCESGGGARTPGGGAGSDRESGTGFLTDFVMDSATVAPFARPGPWPHGSLPQRSRSPPLAVGLPPSLLMQRQHHSPRSTASVISHGSLWVGGAPPPLLDGGVGIALHLGSRSSSIASLGWGGTDGSVSQHLVLPELPRAGSDSAPPVAAALPARRRSGSASMYGSFSLQTPLAASASPSAADAGSHPLSRGVQQLPIVARETDDAGRGLRLWTAAPRTGGDPRKSSDALDLLAAASESEPALTSSSEEDGAEVNLEEQSVGNPSTAATTVPGAALRSNKRLRRGDSAASSAALRMAPGEFIVADATACGGAESSTAAAIASPPLLAGATPTSRRNREKPKRPRGRPKKRLRGAAAMRRSEPPPEGGAGDVPARPPAAAAAVDGMPVVVTTAELPSCEEVPAAASAAAASARPPVAAGVPPATARAVLELQLRSLQGQADWLCALESLARSEPLAVVRAVQEASAALRAAAAALGCSTDSAVPPLISRIVERLRLGEEASPVSLLLRREEQAPGGGPQALALELLAHVPPSRL